ncbi:S-adenosyl-L-methionine-dependent methyltransferase [Stipitochalara longipes BDJ]|nr:S-adenosyl-L-methionine-dependent methyltransferase [Stipitochalara longipes BDJ]
MAEANGRSQAEPELSGEAQGIAKPDLIKKQAPLVQVEEVQTADTAAKRSREVQVLTDKSVTKREEVADERFQPPATAVSALNSSSDAARGAPPTEALSGQGLGSSILDRQSSPSNIETMATPTAAEPIADQAQTPVAGQGQGDEFEVDADYLHDNDLDSTLGDEQTSYSTSLASSVRENYYVHGRRYSAYKDSGYIRPNDETEVDRLDMFHHILKLVSNGKLYEAPLPKDVQRVLDIGCGTGLWAIDFADEHPSAEVLGVDLMPIQPQFVPPNCKFEIDDIEEDFTYRQPFDFIHCRYMAYAVKNWPRLIGQIYAHTTPGGFVEFTDFDLIIRSDDGSMDNTTMQTWTNTLPQAGRLLGREPCPGPKLEQWVRDAGFTNIVTKIYKLPIGPWPKDPNFKLVGAYYHVTVSQGVEGFSLRLYMNVLKWSYEELQVLLAKVRKDLNTRSIHGYTTMYKVMAQRPGGPETAGES